MNLFLGSFDGVLAVMANALPAHEVGAQPGRLRNMRLQQQLQQQGTEWFEFSGRAQFDQFTNRGNSYGLCVVAGFSYILPQNFIDRCQHVINFHPGIIEHCRGPQPVAAAIVNGHKDFGVTVHRINSEAIDAGPLLDQRTEPLDYQASYASNYRTVKRLMAAMAEDLFTRYGDGQWPPGRAWTALDSAYFSRLDSSQLVDLAKAPDLSAWAR